MHFRECNMPNFSRYLTPKLNSTPKQNILVTPLLSTVNVTRITYKSLYTTFQVLRLYFRYGRGELKMLVYVVRWRGSRDMLPKLPPGVLGYLMLPVMYVITKILLLLVCSLCINFTTGYHDSYFLECSLCILSEVCRETVVKELQINII